LCKEELKRYPHDPEEAYKRFYKTAEDAKARKFNALHNKNNPSSVQSTISLAHAPVKDDPSKIRAEHPVTLPHANLPHSTLPEDTYENASENGNLPKGWKRYNDQKSKQNYYISPNGRSFWVKDFQHTYVNGCPLPGKWTRLTDETNHDHYLNPNNGDSQLEPPRSDNSAKAKFID